MGLPQVGIKDTQNTCELSAITLGGDNNVQLHNGDTLDYLTFSAKPNTDSMQSAKPNIDSYAKPNIASKPNIIVNSGYIYTKAEESLIDLGPPDIEPSSSSSNQ